MLKKIASFLIYGIIIAAHAQDKTVDVKLGENDLNIEDRFTQNGNVFFVTKKGKATKPATVNITCYDSLLNLKYSKDFPSEYKTRSSFSANSSQNTLNLYVSVPNGKHVVDPDDHIVIDDTGKLSDNFPYDFNFNVKEKDFETLFDIMSDNYKCFFGMKKDGQPTILRVNLTTFSKEFVPVDLTSFESVLTADKANKSSKEESKSIWGISRYDDKQFFMINKELSKDWSQNQYNIVSFNYDGKVNSTLTILMQLKNKYFALSDTGFGNSKTISGGMAGGAYMDESSTGNIYVEGKNEFFYIYGLYAREKNSNMNKAEYSGFYVYKYNAKGTLVWKTEQQISNSEFNTVQRPLAIKVDLKMLKNNQFGFSICSEFSKYAHLFLINSKDGKVIKNQIPWFKIDDKRRSPIRGTTIPAGFLIDEDNKNISMDFNTIFAAFLSPKVQTFLNKPTTDKLNYICEINLNGIYIVEENVTAKTLKAHKFDW